MERTKISDPIVVKCFCPLCMTERYVTVGATDYANWQNGELAQNAFPYLNPYEREMIISGVCPKCWDKMCGVDDEEKEEDNDHCFEPGRPFVSMFELNP